MLEWGELVFDVTIGVEAATFEVKYFRLLLWALVSKHKMLVESPGNLLTSCAVMPSRYDFAGAVIVAARSVVAIARDKCDDEFRIGGSHCKASSLQYGEVAAQQTNGCRSPLTPSISRASPSQMPRSAEFGFLRSRCDGLGKARAAGGWRASKDLLNRIE